MRTPITWSERLEDRVKREVQVRFVGDTIQWAFLRSDQEDWDRVSMPTPEDWQHLLITAERWYCRRRLPYNHLALIRKRMGLPDPAR